MERRPVGRLVWAGLRFLARPVIGAVFVYAGWLKARHPGQFMHDVIAFRMIPEQAAYWLAAIVPYLEIVAGIALIGGILRRGARLVLLFLSGVFLVALSVAWARHLDISCGCFAGHAVRSGELPRAILRDLLILAGLACATTGRRGARACADEVHK